MDLSDLRIFQAVVREGGVTKAAERLHRVQSGVTTRIRQLEQELGVSLFLRVGRKMHLAPAGQVLLDYAGRLLALAEEATGAVQDPRPRGVFRLGAMESTAAVRLPPILATYHRRHPEVTLELHTGTPRGMATRILAGELDAAFAAEPVPDGPFEKLPAFEEELAIIAAASHPPIAADGATPATMLTFEIGCPHRRRLEAWYEARGAMPTRTIELASYHAMLGCVVAGMGIALLPKSVLATFPERPLLAVHPLPAGLDRSETVLMWRKGGGAPKIAALAALLPPVAAGAKARRTRAA